MDIRFGAAAACCKRPRKTSENPYWSRLKEQQQYAQFNIINGWCVVSRVFFSFFIIAVDNLKKIILALFPS